MFSNPNIFGTSSAAKDPRPNVTRLRSPHKKMQSQWGLISDSKESHKIQFQRFHPKVAIKRATWDQRPTFWRKCKSFFSSGVPLNPCFVCNGKNMRQKSFGNFQDNKRVASDVSLLPTMLALVWSPAWMTSLNEHLQSSFAFICILQCTDVPTLPSMTVTVTVDFFHFSYRNDHFHFLTDTNIILVSSLRQEGIAVSNSFPNCLNHNIYIGLPTYVSPSTSSSPRSCLSSFWSPST